MLKRRGDAVTSRAIGNRRYHGRSCDVKRAIDVVLAVLGATSCDLRRGDRRDRDQISRHPVRCCFSRFESVMTAGTSGWSEVCQLMLEEQYRSNPALWELYVSNDHKLPAHGDPRLTSAGRWLRRLAAPAELLAELRTTLIEPRLVELTLGANPRQNAGGNRWSVLGSGGDTAVESFEISEPGCEESLVLLDIPQPLDRGQHIANPITCPSGSRSEPSGRLLVGDSQ